MPTNNFEIPDEKPVFQKAQRTILKYDPKTEKVLFLTEVVQVKVPDFFSERDITLAAAIEAFSKGSTSVGKAAEISILEFLVELMKRDISAYAYTDKEALKELMI
jgi:predicted HTH domain antitoxin